VFGALAEHTFYLSSLEFTPHLAQLVLLHFGPVESAGVAGVLLSWNCINCPVPTRLLAMI